MSLESIDITQVEQLVELGEMLEESYTETTDKITRLTDLKNEVLKLDEILNESELVAHYEDLINEMDSSTMSVRKCLYKAFYYGHTG